MPFSDFIEQLEEIPLDGNDLIIMSTKLGNPHCKWMVYDDLAMVEHINELFTNADGSDSGINTMFILLQIQSQNGDTIGHWISITKYNPLAKNVLGFEYGHYDPYGFTLDQELSFTHEKPLLTNLLTGVKFEENRVRHQAFKNKLTDINTCGRHCVSRAIFYYLTNKNYNDLIIKPILNRNDVRDPDVMVSVLTGFLPPNDDPVREFFMNRS